jgi:integrating conjugative element protein (TIGR03757 family)
MIRLLFILLMLTTAIGFNSVQAASSDQKVLSVEVFTTADRPVRWGPEVESKDARFIDLQVYELNGIQLVETALSKNLPTDQNQAKQTALKRIQQLDEQATASIQNAAVGLAKAMQYGIDRYPAIVFGGEVVVYGLTDPNAALDYYHQWQAKNRP